MRRFRNLYLALCDQADPVCLGKPLKMAKRSLLRCSAQWSSHVFAVKLDARTDPLYFALETDPKIPTQGRPAFGGLFEDYRKLYSLHVYSDSRTQGVKFYGEVKNKLYAELPPSCDVLEIKSFIPSVKHSVIDGLLIRDRSNSTVTTQLLGELQQNESVCMFSYDLDEDQHLYQQLWSSPSDSGTKNERYYLAPASIPQDCPSTLNIINSDIFYSLEEAYKVLQECADIIPESKAVLELVNQRSDTRSDGGFPVIVIEGLDATGKTTLTESLRMSLGITLLNSPPSCLAPFRQRFDSEPALIRRAFYALGNYITADQIRTASAQAPVIVDRYWHSTAAYGIGTAVWGGPGNLPAPGSEVYRWPEDLLQPSLVLLLTLSPQERLRRLTARAQEKTMEEAELEANHLFRQKVEEAYKRMENPACVIVDASPSPDKVLQQVLLLIRNKCHL